MKLVNALMVGASAMALAIGSAFAADTPKDKDTSTMGKAGNVTRSEDSTFAKLDKNKDGYISKAEAMADPKLSKDFAKFDLNNDGKLNRAEYLAAAAKEDTGKVVDKVTGKDKASEGSSSKPK
jgi:hypothetical protein